MLGLRKFSKSRNFYRVIRSYGGELPAAVIADAVARHIPGVLGKGRIAGRKKRNVRFPVYAKPEIFEFEGRKYGTPKVLLSGHHINIKNWRKKMAL